MNLVRAFVAASTVAMLAGAPAPAVASGSAAASPATAAFIHVDQNNWSLDYDATGSDGVRITSGSFLGEPVFSSLSLPQIRVDYTATKKFNDQLGAGDLPLKWTRVVNLTNGFTVEAMYIDNDYPNECSYKYLNSYQFRDDGRFFPRLVIYGPGCGKTATYKIFWRFDLDVGGTTRDDFGRWTGGAWTWPSQEGGFIETTDKAPNGAAWENIDNQSRLGYQVIPQGPGAGTMTALRYHTGEGEADLPSITWPFFFDNNEPVQRVNVVDWLKVKLTHTRPDTCPPDCGPPVHVGPALVPATG